MVQSIRNNNLSVSTTTCIICHKIKYMLDETQAGIKMKCKLESRFPGEISITSDIQMTPPLWQSEEEIKSLLMKVKEESEKAGLKLNI